MSYEGTGPLRFNHVLRWAYIQQRPVYISYGHITKFILTIDQSVTHHCYLYGNIQRSVKFHYVFHVECWIKNSWVLSPNLMNSKWYQRGSYNSWAMREHKNSKPSRRTMVPNHQVSWAIGQSKVMFWVSICFTLSVIVETRSVHLTRVFYETSLRTMFRHRRYWKGGGSSPCHGYTGRSARENRFVTKNPCPWTWVFTAFIDWDGVSVWYSLYA